MINFNQIDPNTLYVLTEIFNKEELMPPTPKFKINDKVKWWEEDIGIMQGRIIAYFVIKEYNVFYYSIMTPKNTLYSVQEENLAVINDDLLSLADDLMDAREEALNCRCENCEKSKLENGSFSKRSVVIDKFKSYIKLKNKYNFKDSAVRVKDEDLIDLVKDLQKIIAERFKPSDWDITQNSSKDIRDHHIKVAGWELDNSGLYLINELNQKVHISKEESLKVIIGLLHALQIIQEKEKENEKS